MAEATHTTMTAANFLALPESNLPHESIDGEEVLRPAPKDIHQKVSGLIYQLLLSAVTSGEIRYSLADVYLDEGNVVHPDLF